MQDRRQIILIVHNVRSCHNVGSLLRTADGLGIERVYLTGYTPYPLSSDDTRLPHESRKIDVQIHKTALGAERTVAWTATRDIFIILGELRSKGYVLAALEQAKNAISLPSYHPPPKIALLVGREVEGIELEVLAKCGICLEIPMLGTKESYNVASAAAIGLYHIRYSSSRNAS
jgi:23S rRNA (guanosine2251-2'-O)-methyltransferase